MAITVTAAASPLPQLPDFVLGVINLRGTVLSIVDLAVRLGLGPNLVACHGIAAFRFLVPGALARCACFDARGLQLGPVEKGWEQDGTSHIAVGGCGLARRHRKIRVRVWDGEFDECRRCPASAS